MKIKKLSKVVSIVNRDCISLVIGIIHFFLYMTSMFNPYINL